MKSISQKLPKREVKTDGLMWISCRPGCIALVPSGAKIPRSEPILETFKRMVDEIENNVSQLRKSEAENHRQMMEGIAKKLEMNVAEVEARWEEIMSKEDDYSSDLRSTLNYYAESEREAVL